MERSNALGYQTMPYLFVPITRAISQLDDPILLSVLLRSFAWSIASFIALHFATIWMLQRMLEVHGWLAWGVGVLGSVAASFLTLWLFLPVAAAIGTMYLDRIALAVEHRFYRLPPPNGASFIEQSLDGIEVALKVLGLNILGLMLTLMLPGIGLLLGWIIAAYAIGRGLFVAVAMRRMPRDVAESIYHANRGIVLAQGAVLALAAYVPVMNLLIPVIGVAAMVHVLDMAITAAETKGR